MPDYSKPFLAFIAHLRSPKADHVCYREDLTSRGFPCIISNDLNSGKEYPHQEQSCALNVTFDRSSTIKNDQNRFFIYFIDDVSSLGEVELGLAIGCNTEKICLIGERRLHGYHFHPRVEHYSCWDNFIYRNFFAP